MNSKQKNIFIILLLTLSLMLCACQSNNESMPTTTAAPTVPTIPINPLADKQYEPFVYEAGADFFAFLDPLNAEYSEHLINMADYFTKHANEIEVEGKGLSDFDDYEENFDAYYCFLYGIMFCDSTNIPNEYQNAWSLYLTTAWTNKYDLDNLYWLKGDELVAAASNMMTTIEAGFTLIGEAIPNAVSKQVSIGEMISLEFVEMTMEYLNVSDKILPEDTDSSYSYIPDVENEQYFCIAGTLKNLSGASYDVESIYVEMVFDEKYTYNGQLSACAWTNDFYGSYVKPLGTVKYYLHASIPDELIDSWKTCSVTFGFKENFDSGYYVEKAECDYLYTINLERQQ